LSDYQARSIEAEDIKTVEEQLKSGKIPSLEYDETPLATFAYGAYAYTGISNLLLKKAVFTDLGTNTVLLTNRKALGQSMDLSREQALKKISLLQEVNGSIPDSLITNLSLAEAKRYGSDTEMLQAFAAYWRCSLLADLSLEFLQYKQ
ncbi:MAG: hypothetical protein AAF585_14460, partial [Verrucomicrobiota bacterium]